MLDIINTIIMKIIIIGTSLLMLFGVVDDTATSTLLQEKVQNGTQNAIEYATNIITPPIVTTIQEAIDKKSVGDEKLEEKTEEFTPPSPTADTLDITQTEIPQMIVSDEPITTSQQDTTEKKTIRVILPSQLNTLVRNSVVNIFCLSAGGGLFEPISGSGIIIDERGVILTNAHVAQYFLLKNFRQPNYIECLIRTGSPARNAYRAKLLYLSPQWVEKNTTNIVKPSTTATGEEDYALLLITAATQIDTQLPDIFPTTIPFPIATTIYRGAPLLVASYPAGFIGGIAINRDLWITSSIATIKDIFTFKEDGPGTLDLISVGGVVGAQEGSSGGAVVSLENARLLGVIVTRTSGDTTAERDLRALSLSHINTSIKEQTGKSLKEFLFGDLNEKVEEFASTTAPTLTEKLIEGLKG